MAAIVDLPIAVMVNQNSASAAEIVAACLQDHGRAIVVGQRSYGKGTVQQLLPLESGKSLLKLTWASFWRPSGANIHRAVGVPDDAKWGVLPDAGYERKLSPENIRPTRNIETIAMGSAKSTRRTMPSAMPQSKTADFVDKPLQLAVEYLRGKLGGQPVARWRTRPTLLSAVVGLSHRA